MEDGDTSIRKVVRMIKTVSECMDGRQTRDGKIDYN